MNTKLRGDIAEQTLGLRALRNGWGVSKPVGDRLPYDLILDVDGQLHRVQVKSAWFDENSQTWMTDTRRTKTNRRRMKREKYKDTDFDLALVFIEKLDVWYVIPPQIFNSYTSTLTLAELVGKQRAPRSLPYREAWHLVATPS